MHRDLEGGPSTCIVCRGRALVAALFVNEKQARHSCQAVLLAWIPLDPIDRPLSEARLRSGTQERWYSRLGQNADWVLITTGLALFSAAVRSGRGPDSACRSNIGCLAPPACCYPTFSSGKRTDEG